MPAFRIAAAALAALILSPLAQAQYGQPIGRPLDAGPVNSSVPCGAARVSRSAAAMASLNPNASSA